MKPRIVGAADGVRWLADGWRLFRRSPLGWMAAVFTYWLVMTLLSVVPLAGIAAAAILVPVFWVGFMAVGRAAERAGRIELGALFDGFRHELPAQLVLGVVYLACISLVLGASALAGYNARLRWWL